MLDINFIRENSGKVKKSIVDRKSDMDLDKLLKFDEQRRDLTQKVDELRAKKNAAAKNKNIEEGKKIKEDLGGLEKQLTEVELEWTKLMYQVPNILLDEVPVGDASANKVIRKEGGYQNLALKSGIILSLGKVWILLILTGE